MKIFVWKSYGSVKVYALSTVEQVCRVFHTLSDSVTGWGIDKEIIDLCADIEQSNSVSESIGVLRDLIDTIGIGSHETLEHGSSIETLKE